MNLKVYGITDKFLNPQTSQNFLKNSKKVEKPIDPRMPMNGSIFDGYLQKGANIASAIPYAPISTVGDLVLYAQDKNPGHLVDAALNYTPAGTVNKTKKAGKIVSNVVKEVSDSGIPFLQMTQRLK